MRDLYPIWFYAAWILLYVVQRPLTRVGARRVFDDLRVDMWQAAFVAGGYRRVVETAIAGLALHDQIAVTKHGKVSVAPAANPAGPIERAVCDALRGNPSRRSVLRRMRHDPLVLAVEEGARSRGLMLGGTRLAWWYLTLAAAVAVMSVGVVRGIRGIQGPRAGEFQVALAFVSLVILFVLITRLRVRHRPSYVGRAAMGRMSQLYRSEQPGATQAGVAVYGYSAIHGDALRWALKKHAGTARAGGD